MTELQQFRRELRAKAAAEKPTTPKQSQYISPYGGAFSRVVSRVSTIPLETALRNWAGICINMRAAGFAETEIVTVRDGKEVKEPLLENLFNNPNDTQTWYDIKEQLCKWRDSRGNAYLWTPTGGTKSPLFMYVLPATNVTAILNSGRQGASVSHYEYLNGDGAAIKLATSEILHWRCFVPSKREYENWVIGQPAELLAAANGVLNDEERARFMNDYYSADATPPFVITTPEELPASPADSEFVLAGSWEEFRSRLSAMLPSAYKPIAVLDEGKELVPLMSATAGTQLAGSNPDEEIRRVVAAAFKIPLAFLTGEDENRANGKNNTARFYKNAVYPLVSSFEAVIAKHFGQWFPNIRFTHEKYVDIDETIAAQQLEFAAMQGYVTGDEWLSLAGIQVPTTTTEQSSK